MRCPHCGKELKAEKKTKSVSLGVRMTPETRAALEVKYGSVQKAFDFLSKKRDA